MSFGDSRLDVMFGSGFHFANYFIVAGGVGRGYLHVLKYNLLARAANLFSLKIGQLPLASKWEFELIDSCR
jgi:hypothetical protein